MKNVNCRINERSLMLEVVSQSLSMREKNIIEEVINACFENCDSEYKDKYIVKFLGRTFDFYKFEVELKDFSSIEELFESEEKDYENYTNNLWININKELDEALSA